MNNTPKEAQEPDRRRRPDYTAQQIRADLATCLDTEELLRALDCIDPYNATVGQRKE